MDIPKLAEHISDRWRGLKKLAAELVAQLPMLTRRGNRGVKHNLAILESWLRAALLQLADVVELPARRRTRRDSAQATKRVEPESVAAARRPGFRAIEPDDYERQLATPRNRFDISAYDGARHRGLYDPRPGYARRLAAIEAVLEAPERYARRVRRKLEARRKRPSVTHLKISHRSALPDLLQVSPTSEIGRALWYNDSS